MTRFSRLAVSMLLVQALGMSVFVPATAHAQSYPAKPVRLIISYPPGGGLDQTGRMVAQQLSASLGQPVVVENRAGAGGTIAEDFVSKAEPDGYTILYTVGSDMASRKFLTRKPTLDPLKDLTPVATAIGSVNIVLVNAAQPAKTFKQLVDFAKRNPGKLSYGTAGVQSYYYLIGELLNQNGMKMLHVPYKGNAPVVAALLGGEIDVALVNFAAALPLMKSGKGRALAVMESKRYAGEPDVPTVSEELPAFKAPLSWFGYFGPPGLPQPIVVKLNAEIARALDAPEVRTKIGEQYLNILQTPPDQLRPFIAETADLFGKIIKTANIKPFDD
jgi:tripartite-type tricarboxylate transporter receptor subunit TctC